MPARRVPVFPGPLPARYARHLTEALRTETLGGALVLAAAGVALVWANSPWSGSYQALRTAEVGPAALHLNLDLATWAADGLLAIFFFVAGLEVKEEVIHGELRHLRDAVLPIVAAAGGMAVPALVFLAASIGTPGAAAGWAIPMATDIAFALAVLAVAAPAMPTSLRAFLLTLAVVDDLGAIAIIAVFYTDELRFFSLLGAVALLAIYALLQNRGGWAHRAGGRERRRLRAPWVYVPLALAVWVLVHESGVHATVAGVALGLLTRVVSAPGETTSPGERADHLLRPVSAGFAIPVFALFAAGIPLSGSTLAGVFADRIALGVILGLVVGKFLGVFGGAFLAARLRFARLAEDLHWRDIAAVAFLTGGGFTVSLLIGELAYGSTARSEHVTAAILIASLAASLIAAVLLRLRARQRVSGASKEGAMSEARVEPPTERAVEPPAERAVEDLSLGELVALVSRDVSKLVHTEIALAKAELRSDVKRAGLGAGMFGAAGFFGYVALLFCSAALAFGLVALGLPMWAGFLIVGGGYVLLAGIVGLVGMLNFRRMSRGQRTAQTIRANLTLVRRGG